jgi:hypothetical protein
MHPKSYPICLFLCIQTLSNQQLQRYSVNGKSAVQWQQNEDDLHILQPITHSIWTWFKSLVTLTDTKEKHFSHPKKMHLNMLFTVAWKCIFVVTRPQ